MCVLPGALGYCLLLKPNVHANLCATHCDREAVAAADNLKFLLCLEEPCKTLAKAHPQEIPQLLPPILNCIRMVWNISRFYNTPDRITVLLRKVRTGQGRRGVTGATLLSWAGEEEGTGRWGGS